MEDGARASKPGFDIFIQISSSESCFELYCCLPKSHHFQEELILHRGFPKYSLRLLPLKKGFIEIVFKIDGDTWGTLTPLHATCIFGGKVFVNFFSTSLPQSQPAFGVQFASELPTLLNPVSGLFRHRNIHNYN